MKKILVIDDNKLIVENIKDVLKATGFDVIIAYDGEEGLKLALEAKPDLIICDLMLPKVDGFQVLKTLKNNFEVASIPIIVITTKEKKDDLNNAKKLGADDVLTKPFSPEDLFIKVDSLIKKSKDLKNISENAVRQLTLNLISTMPHELRTPLNGIIGTADYLVKFGKSLSQNELDDFYKVLFQAATRLNELIYRYLLYVDTELILNDTDRIATARNTVAFLPKERIHNLINDFINTKGKNHNITFNFQDSNIKIYEEHLNFIIKELLDNAVKFSSPNTSIVITGITIDNQYIIECIDNGRGMTQEEIEQLSAMKQFKRDIYEQQGLGLGLAIVQRLVKVYDGEFKIESEENKYTKIIIKLKCFS